ncbi:Cysteine and histidine-rich protein 1-B [Lamellibrachia satsuma]|nr:Cysteine and histidine-rich protein 1-B [Lamellibrachia satsuma]
MAEEDRTAESAGVSCRLDEDVCENYEPLKKKSKLDVQSSKQPYKLEERLNGILCCAVCLDLPAITVFQCSNGHLMCASCLSHLLADARLKDESATCPNCRCEISKTACIRNLAVEKAISELPAECRFCSLRLPRSELAMHEKELCQERRVPCKFERIGCPWEGPPHEVKEHENVCTHPSKPAADIMDLLDVTYHRQEDEMRLYKNIFNLLSLEKITFSDLQLRPYRTDDYISKLFYETSRFSAFSHQWVVKVRVNDNQKHPVHSPDRTLTYQLVLKSKLPSTPMQLQYVAIEGPYTNIHMNPAIYKFDFSNEAAETDYQLLPIVSSVECNKLLAARSINLRLILFQLQA